MAGNGIRAGWCLKSTGLPDADKPVSPEDVFQICPQFLCYPAQMHAIKPVNKTKIANLWQGMPFSIHSKSTEYIVLKCI